MMNKSFLAHGEKRIHDENEDKRTENRSLKKNKTKIYNIKSISHKTVKDKSRMCVCVRMLYLKFSRKRVKDLAQKI